MKKLTLNIVKDLEVAQNELIGKSEGIIIKDYFKKYKLSNYFRNDKNILIRIKLKTLYQNQSEIRALKKELIKNNLKIDAQLDKKYQWNKLEIASIKKNLQYFTGILDFNSLIELGSIPLFTGIDFSIMYQLKFRKRYNYKEFCKTYQISINDLRNEVNLKLLNTYQEELQEILKEYDLDQWDQIHDLPTNIKNQFLNWLNNKIMIILRDYCINQSNVLNIPNTALHGYIDNNGKKISKLNYNRFRIAKKMLNNRSTNQFMSIQENNQNQSKSNIVKIKTREKVNNVIMINSKIICEDGIKFNKNLKNNFVNIIKIKNDNDKSTRAINYKKLIKSLYSDIKIKDSLLSQNYSSNNFKSIDLEYISLNFPAVKMYYIESLSQDQLCKVFQVSKRDIKKIIDNQTNKCKEYIKKQLNKDYYINNKLNQSSLLNLYNQY